ncbi:MAG: FtsB family cell division protein [Bryobacteraceae bacterium]
MTTLYRRILYTAAVALLGAYGYFTLRGPQGISALMEKRNQIRQLEEENAAMARENDRKRERIRKLGESVSQLKLEIRDKTKKILPGETEFVLPEMPKQALPAADRPTAQ